MKTVAAVAIALVASYGASAQQADPGAVAFRWNCAPCHGLDGKGDGLPSDLTTLAKKNGGKFPAAQVYGIVQDTWAGTNMHRHMPIMGFDVRSRSSVIVDYVRSIQEK
jgi:mono/diheme cytochrome c family protein